MQHDFDVFLSIGEIAGVFVGFGALIALTRTLQQERRDLIRMGSVVTIGVYVIVGALIPVARLVGSNSTVVPYGDGPARYSS